MSDKKTWAVPEDAPQTPVWRDVDRAQTWEDLKSGEIRSSGEDQSVFPR
ncbi:hypothetical protein [Corynebacterium oculi]|uniref:Uncharacterized protein n=1 Tax=Corynebacterium oculi TaxID=1544416 RepID=A0A0Q1DUP2_9CORY|nr:hypothetical protein [Corynebacterium oculi]KQB83846.1 hypothetical protein Cocul_01919 [Corynebacterium oculi]